MAPYEQGTVQHCAIPEILRELLLPYESLFASEGGTKPTDYEALKKEPFIREEDAQNHALLYTYSGAQLRAALAAMQQLAQPLAAELGQEKSWPILLLERDKEKQEEAPEPLLELSKRTEKKNPVAGIVSLCHHDYTLQLILSDQPIAEKITFVRHFEEAQVAVIDCRQEEYEVRVAYPEFRKVQPVWDLKKGGRELFEKKKDVYDFAIQSAENQRESRRLLVLGSETDDQLLIAHGIGEHQRVENEDALADELAKNPAYCILCSDPEKETALKERGFADYKDYFVISRSAQYVDELLRRPLPPGAETATMHIMTSCDAKLMPQVFIQLEELYENMPNRKIKFYVFHAGISRPAFDELKAKAGIFPNIDVISVVPDEAAYDKMLGMASWGWWPKEMFYWICAHRYLPEDVERLLCVDAGDVMIDGDISPFYFDDFEENALIATMEGVNAYQEITPHGEVKNYTPENLWHGTQEQQELIWHGTFNSGVVLLNLEYMRAHGYTEKNYMEFCAKISQHKPGEQIFGDQALMSMFFLGKIKYYGQKIMPDEWFRPYNFVLYFFDGRYLFEPYYHPALIHFAGMYTAKPWLTDYARTFRIGTSEERAKINDYQDVMRSYYEKWSGYYIRAQLRLNTQKYLAHFVEQQREIVVSRAKCFLELLKLRVLMNVPYAGISVSGIDPANDNSYIFFPLTQDNLLHYEILCTTAGSVYVCLHFEGGWHQNPAKQSITEQAGVLDREDPVDIALTVDHTGCFYRLLDYDDQKALLYLRRLVKLTLPLLHQKKLIDDAAYLAWLQKK